jgi:hypothetical protein
LCKQNREAIWIDRLEAYPTLSVRSAATTVAATEVNELALKLDAAGRGINA